MLAENGLDFSEADPLLTWEIFKQFVQLPISDHGVTEMVLFECGVVNFTGEDLFNLSFVRQYEFSDSDGEYDRMEQVHCELQSLPTVELNRIQTNLWAEDCASLQDFFRQVESLHEFQVAVKHRPYTLDVIHEQV
jgi:hypothetical protein